MLVRGHHWPVELQSSTDTMEQVAKRLQEATLLQRKRDELNELKAKRIEKSKGPATSFSGKQKKVQMREKKARIQQRRDDIKAFANEPFFVEGSEEPIDFNTLKGIRTSTLKLSASLGRQTKDLVDKEVSSFFVKETKEQVQLRIMEGQYPIDMSHRKKPLLWKELTRDPLLDFPQRPSWNYKQSKEKLHENESIMFDDWLANIHDKYDVDELNHFEHNLEVWRELWRVLERSSHIVIVADIRNPLLHIPPSVYDYVTERIQKPLIIVLNKIDLIPLDLALSWRASLTKRFPKATLLYFSSRSKSIQHQTDLNGRRKVLSEKLKIGDLSAVQGAQSILIACGIDPEAASVIIHSVLQADDEGDENGDENGDNADVAHPTTTPATKKSRRKNKEKVKLQLAEARELRDVCDYCGDDAPVVSCQTCATSFRDLRLCGRCNRDIHKHQRHKVVPLEGCAEAAAAAAAEADELKRLTITIGLIGHPNVGKSSVLNALAGKKLVSVSHTPGHTKRLQSIFIAPHICICDCPGLVFPFAGVPKHMQELGGLFPYSQTREPFSAVRFLAEHAPLESILNLAVRTQEFDGYLEPLEWSSWTLCEAYAEKKGYKTERRGRPDHHRAGAELIRDCMDGVLPLYFYPPDYTGPYLDGTQNASYCGDDAVHKLNHLDKNVANAPPTNRDDTDDESDDDNGDVDNAKQSGGHTSAWNLLNDDSSDEESSDDE
ncbi:hypothetical protein DYB38_000659 [Aphanomyces astaci]|uniref:Guanine nucleotide-binding protein-like 1 n=2 Tax=Aphanomyces astaci TaxID=112090 RepID=A0A397FCC0_APHAT|nr:hypothetical protein DYB38_000659 [Aphanomyces astaci]RHZ17694.1 hypothetical protein DYB31_010147 [Aphanomyces astaci]